MSATSRSVYRDTITVTRHPDGVLLPAAGAQVRFYEPNGSALTPLSVPLYGSADSTTPLVLPLLASAVGEVEVWSDEAAGLRARQVVQYRDRPVSDEVVDFEPPPGTYATRLYVDAAVGTHEAAANPHAQYLTQPEGNLLYLPLGTPIPDAYTKTQSDARYEPLDSAYTKTESDGRYQGLALLGQPNGYPPLDANGLLPTTYLPPLAITDTFVATSEAQMLALTAQRGDVCVRADLGQTYILAADPATVLANWVQLASSAVSGTATVLDQEEFAPAAAATTVTLAAVPTDVLEVTRNGVAQSLAAGHYTVAGAVVTFTDAFAAGERVAVLYAVGTSVITDAYTKGQSDSRYEPLDSAYTKGESDSRYAPAGAGGAVDSVNGQVGVVVLAASDVGALTQATADSRYEPVDSAYTKVEADARYATPASVTSAVSTHAAAADPHTTYYNQTRADARYLQTANAFTQTLADTRYLQLAGGTLTGDLNISKASAPGITMKQAADTQVRMSLTQSTLSWGPGGVSAQDTNLSRFGANDLRADSSFSPTTTSARDLGTTALRWAKVWAVNAEFTNPPTYGGAAQPKITVAVSAPGSPATGDLWVW